MNFHQKLKSTAQAILLFAPHDVYISKARIKRKEVSLSTQILSIQDAIKCKTLLYDTLKDYCITINKLKYWQNTVCAKFTNLT